MQRLGRYRVVERRDGRLRLEKSDRVGIAEGTFVLLLLAYVGVAPVVESPLAVATLVPSLALAFSGLLLMSRLGSRGSLTRVVHSIVVDRVAGGGYRSASGHRLLVDGREVEVPRAIAMRAISQGGRAPDVFTLYLVGRTDAWLVDSSQDPSALVQLAAAIGEALGIARPPGDPLGLPRSPSEAPYEPRSGTVIVGVIVYLFADLAAGGALVGLLMTGLAGTAVVPLERAVVCVAGRLLVHALLVFGFARLVAGAERQRADAMFANVRAPAG